MSSMDRSGARSGFFGTRLAGTAPLETVFWRDMLVVGTGFTLLTLVSALSLAAMDAPMWAVIGVYVSALPYNIFIAVAVWRSSRSVPSLQRTMVRIVAGFWLVVALIL